MTFFWEKNSIFRAHISHDLFKVINQFFRIFPFFSQIFRVFTMLNVVYDPCLTRKTHFSYSVHTFGRIRQHYFSKYWGDGFMGVPHLKFWTGPSHPVPPRSPPLLILSANTKSVTTVPFYPFYWRRRLLLHPGASILEVGAEGGRGDSRGSWTGREILLYLIMYRKYT